MNNRMIIFALGIYLSISISISGYLYFNPERTLVSNNDIYKQLTGINHYHNNYTNFRYSLLIFLVGFILLFSILQLFKKSKNSN